MEIPSTSSIAVLLIATALVAWTWRVLEWVWFRPKKLERQLRQQGLGVHPYRLLHGDLKEVTRTGFEATLTPMPDFSHDYLYRIRPFLHRNITKHGKVCVTWEGPLAVVNVGDAEMVKEVLLKHDEFLKPKANPLTALLVRGLGTFDGQKWAQHWKLINPAFHIQKLKVHIFIVVKVE